MITFHQVVKQSRPIGVMQREYNNMVRESLRVAAYHWIETYLPRHFQQGAFGMYQYAPRGGKYLQMKRDRDTVKVNGKEHPIRKPPMPLVLTGRLLDSIKGKSPQAYNVRPTATANKVTVKIPVRLPHPMSTEHANEIVKTRREEWIAMHEVATTHLEMLLSKINKVETKKIS